MTVTEAAALLRSRKLSCVELTRECCRRIAEQNGRFNAFVTVTEEAALARAGELDWELASGRDRGPLHGIPVAHKDLIATEGVRTTSGSKLFETYTPDCDAAVVEKLNGAGAVCVGKTGLHELAYGITSANPHFGAVRNPQDPERVAGGSSGGSGVAVATGMALLATGTDTGGSIRIPSSFCGVVGLKPTYGRVSRYGVRPLGFTLDHVGPIAGTVRDAALMLNTIAGFDPRDASCSRQPVDEYVPDLGMSLAGVRIGWPANFFFDGVEPGVRTVVEQVFSIAEQLGATVKRVTLPDVAALNTVARVILLSEASAIYARDLDHPEMFGADVYALLQQGLHITATEYIQAQQLRNVLIDEFRKAMDGVDVLFTPTTPTVAPLIGQNTMVIGGEQRDVRIATTTWARNLNALGSPGISLPCGTAEHGLPAGLQIVGKPWREKQLLSVAAALEDALR